MVSRRNSICSTSSISSNKSNLIRDISTDNLLTIEEKFTKQSINSKKKQSSSNFHKNNSGIYYFPNGEVFKPRSNNHQKRIKPEKLNQPKIQRNKLIVPGNYRASISANSSALSLNSLTSNTSPIQRSYSNPNFNHLPMDLKNSTFKKNPYAKDDMFKLQSNNIIKSNFDTSSNQNISLQSLPEKENQGFSSLSSTSSTYSSSSSTSITDLKNQPLLPNSLSNIDKQNTLKIKENMIIEEPSKEMKNNDNVGEITEEIQEPHEPQQLRGDKDDDYSKDSDMSIDANKSNIDLQRKLLAKFEDIDTSPDSQSTPNQIHTSNDLIDRDGNENENENSLKNGAILQNKSPQLENFIPNTDRKLEDSFIPLNKSHTIKQSQSINQLENIHDTRNLHVSKSNVHEKRGSIASTESNNISPISNQKSLNHNQNPTMDYDNLLNTYEDDYIDDSPLSNSTATDEIDASPPNNNLKTPIRKNEHNSDNLCLSTPVQTDTGKSPIDQVFPTDEYGNADVDINGNVGDVPTTPRKNLNTEMESPASSLPSPDFRYKTIQDTHYTNFTANSNGVDDDADSDKDESKSNDFPANKSGVVIVMDQVNEKIEDDIRNEKVKVLTQDDLINKKEEQGKEQEEDKEEEEEEEEDDVPPRRDLIRRHHSLIIENPDIPLRRDLQSGSIRNKRLSGLQEPTTPNRLSLSSSIVESPALVLAPAHKTIPQSKRNPIDYTSNRKPIMNSAVETPRPISSGIIPGSLPSTPMPQLEKAIKKSTSLPRLSISQEKAQTPSKPISNFRLFFQRLFSKDSSKSTKTSSSKHTPTKRRFGKNKQKGELTEHSTPEPIIQEESNILGDVLPALPPKDKPKKVKSQPVTVPVKIPAPIFDSPNMSLKPSTRRPKTSTGFTRKSNKNSTQKKATETKDFKFMAPNMRLKAQDRNSWKNDESLTLTRLPSISTGSIRLMDDLMNTFDRIDDDENPKIDKFLPLDIYDCTGHLKSTGTIRSVRSDIFLKDDELSIAQIKDQQIKDSAINGGSSSASLDDDYVDDNIRFLQKEFNWKEYDTTRFSVSQLENSDSDEEEVLDYSKLYVSQKTHGNCEVVVINQDQLVNVFKKTSQRKRLPNQIKYIKQFQDFKTVKVDYQEYEDLSNSLKLQTTIIKSNSIIKTEKASVKKQVMFSNSISINETFAPDMYKRYNKSVTQYTLTEPSEINKIKIELNNYKSNEMLVHELSQNNTHFFYS